MAPPVRDFPFRSLMKPVMLVLFLLGPVTTVLGAEVRVEALPEPGLQPQVVVSDAGVVHLVYLSGDPKSCDVRHTTRPVAGGDWAPPKSVNHKAGSAIAIGTIRGAQLALGKDESVHVVWNGRTNPSAGRTAEAPLFHARLGKGEKTFGPARDLMGETTALDGGASIIANGKGHLAVVWHGAPRGEQGEGARLVWTRSSTDNGLSFSPPRALNRDEPGVCACCSLRAHLSADDTLNVIYRAATAKEERGMVLLTGKGEHSVLEKLDDWRIASCPMSSASLLSAGTTLRAAWENDGRIVTRLVSDPADPPRMVGPSGAKHPVLAQNSGGETLLVCLVGSGWSAAGTLHWDLLGPNGKVSASGDGTKLPVWSHAAVYAKPDGSFVILH